MAQTTHPCTKADITSFNDAFMQYFEDQKKKDDPKSYQVTTTHKRKAMHTTTLDSASENDEFFKACQAKKHLKVHKVNDVAPKCALYWCNKPAELQEGHNVYATCCSIAHHDRFANDAACSRLQSTWQQQDAMDRLERQNVDLQAQVVALQAKVVALQADM